LIWFLDQANFFLNQVYRINLVKPEQSNRNLVETWLFFKKNQNGVIQKLFIKKNPPTTLFFKKTIYKLRSWPKPWILHEPAGLASELCWNYQESKYWTVLRELWLNSVSSNSSIFNTIPQVMALIWVEWRRHIILREDNGNYIHKPMNRTQTWTWSFSNFVPFRCLWLLC